MNAESKTIEVTNNDLQSFQEGVAVILASEKYPDEKDNSLNVLEGDPGWAVSRLVVELEPEMKRIKTDTEKINKKYKSSTDDKGRFLEGKEKEKEAFIEEKEKYGEKKQTLTITHIPHPELWNGYKCSPRAYARLDKLFIKKEKSK